MLQAKAITLNNAAQRSPLHLKRRLATLLFIASCFVVTDAGANDRDNLYNAVLKIQQPKNCPKVIDDSGRTILSCDSQKTYVESHRNQNDHSQLEAGICLPGMPCYSVADKSLEQLQDLQAGLGRLINTSVVGDDNREPVLNAGGSELSGVGFLENGTLGGGGTAFLVGKNKCHILTNAHVLMGTMKEANRIDDYKDKEKIQSLDMAIHLGRLRRNPKTKILEPEMTVLAHPVRWGPYRPSNPFDSEDWALLELEPCISDLEGGDKFTSLPIATADLADVQNKKGKFMLPGYSDDKDWAKGVWVDRSCSVHSIIYNSPKEPDAAWGHDCDNMPGSSGGPLLRRHRDGKLYVYAMNAGSYGASSRKTLENVNDTHTNAAVSMKHVYPLIKDLIEP